MMDIRTHGKSLAPVEHQLLLTRDPRTISGICKQSFGDQFLGGLISEETNEFENIVAFEMQTIIDSERGCSPTQTFSLTKTSVDVARCLFFKNTKVGSNKSCS